MDSSSGTDILWVLGMHRSGTSALTRLLNLLGVHLGEPLLPPMAGVNDLGFWEHQGVVDLNDRLLGALGSSWFDPRPLPYQWWTRPELEPLRNEAARLLREQFAGHSLAAVKDPRLCRTLPFWLTLAHEAGLRSKAVLVLRHPSEVAASLRKRDRFPLQAAAQLWLRYVLEAEFYVRPLPHTRIHYQWLLADWRDCAQRMATELNLTWPIAPQEAADSVGQELRPNLRRQRDTGCQSLSENLVAVEQALSETPIDAARLDALRKQIDGLDGFYLDSMNALYGALEQIIIERQRQEESGRLYEHAAALVRERDAQLAQREAEHRETARLYEHAAAIVAERDAQLAALNSQLQDLGQLYAHAQSVVRERDAALSALQAERLSPPGD